MSNAEVFLFEFIKDYGLLSVFHDGVLNFESYCRMKLNRLRCMTTKVGNYEVIHDKSLDNLLRCIFHANKNWYYVYIPVVNFYHLLRCTSHTCIPYYFLLDGYQINWLLSTSMYNRFGAFFNILWKTWKFECYCNKKFNPYDPEANLDQLLIYNFESDFFTWSI